MISRKSSLAIATAYAKRFTSRSRTHRGIVSETIFRDSVYDFLYENDYEAWFCNLAKTPNSARAFKEFWLKIHTGESLVSATKDWEWKQRRALGQRLLRSLARDYIRWQENLDEHPFLGTDYKDQAASINRSLELDGYVYRDRDFLQQQSDILDLDEETGLLNSLFKRTGLARSSDAFEFLRLGEAHFLAGRWSDCISNVRKFFELTLQEGARSLGAIRGNSPSEASLARPVEVRQYLEQEGLVEKKEREALDKLYGLLSETGAHPYMAESDQARLLRQVSLTISQFVLLRLEAALKPAEAQKSA